MDVLIVRCPVHPTNHLVLLLRGPQAVLKKRFSLAPLETDCRLQRAHHDDKMLRHMQVQTRAPDRRQKKDPFVLVEVNLVEIAQRFFPFINQPPPVALQRLDAVHLQRLRR